MNDKIIVRKVLGIDLETFNHETAQWSELHEMRSTINENSRSLLDKCEKDHRDLKDDEKRAFDAIMKVLDNITVEFNDRAAEGTREPLTGIARSIHLSDTPSETENYVRRIGIVTPDQNRASKLWKSDSVKVSAESYYRQVAGMEARTQNIGSGADGGFTVPSLLWNNLWDAALEGAVALPKVQVYKMQSATLAIPAWDGADHSTELYGGFEGTLQNEATPAQPQTGQFRIINLTSRKFSIYARASREIAADSTVGFAGQLTGAMVRALQFKLDDFILTGSGIGQPKGAIKEASTITATRTNSASITYTDLITMIGRMYPGFLNGAEWYMSPSAYQAVLGITDGQGRYFYAPVGGNIQSGPALSLLGYPINVTEKLPGLGTAGDITLANMGCFALGLRENPTVESTNAEAFLSDLTTFRCLLRADGCALLNTPITPRGGGSTLSWCVILSTK